MDIQGFEIISSKCVKNGKHTKIERYRWVTITKETERDPERLRRISTLTWHACKYTVYNLHQSYNVSQAGYTEQCVTGRVSKICIAT